MDQLAYDRTAGRRRKRRGALVAILLGASLATMGAGAMSLAVFTDSQAADGSWTTGTIILGVTPSTTFDVSGILPGDDGTQTVTVANNGTGELRYALTTSATDPDGKGLAAQMDLVITDAACGSAGTELYNGSLAGAKIGDPAQGDLPGNDPTVLAGESAQLCFAWSFPLTSGDTYQNAKTDATFTFDAEQVANNP